MINILSILCWRQIYTHTRARTHTQHTPDFTPAATAYWMDVSLWKRTYCGYCYSNDPLKQQYGNQGSWSLCLQIIRLSALYTHQLVTVRGLPSQIAHNARVCVCAELCDLVWVQEKGEWRRLNWHVWIFHYCMLARATVCISNIMYISLRDLGPMYIYSEYIKSI